MDDRYYRFKKFGSEAPNDSFFNAFQENLTGPYQKTTLDTDGTPIITKHFGDRKNVYYEPKASAEVIPAQHEDWFIIFKTGGQLKIAPFDITTYRMKKSYDLEDYGYFKTKETYTFDYDNSVTPYIIKEIYHKVINLDSSGRETEVEKKLYYIRCCFSLGDKIDNPLESILASGLRDVYAFNYYGVNKHYCPYEYIYDKGTGKLLDISVSSANSYSGFFNYQNQNINFSRDYIWHFTFDWDAYFVDYSGWGIETIKVVNNLTTGKLEKRIISFALIAGSEIDYDVYLSSTGPLSAFEGGIEGGYPSTRGILWTSNHNGYFDTVPFPLVEDIWEFFAAYYWMGQWHEISYEDYINGSGNPGILIMYSYSRWADGTWTEEDYYKVPGEPFKDIHKTYSVLYYPEYHITRTNNLYLLIDSELRDNVWGEQIYTSSNYAYYDAYGTLINEGSTTLLTGHTQLIDADDAFFQVLMFAVDWSASPRVIYCAHIYNNAMQVQDTIAARCELSPEEIRAIIYLPKS